MNDDEIDALIAHNQLLLDDLYRLRKAGNALAIAALHVADQYDGVHRLMLSVSNWAMAIANEGGRPFPESPE